MPRFSTSRNGADPSVTRLGDPKGSHLQGQLRLPRDVNDPQFVVEVERLLRELARPYDNYRELNRSDMEDELGRVTAVIRSGSEVQTSALALTADITEGVDIGGLDQDTSPNVAADFIMTQDVSAGEKKRVLLRDVVRLRTKSIDNTDSPYSVESNVDVIAADTSSGSITVNLPPVTSHDGRQILIKKTSASNTLTLDGDGSETVEGATTQAITTLNESKTLVAFSSGWLYY